MACSANTVDRMARKLGLEVKFRGVTGRASAVPMARDTVGGLVARRDSSFLVGSMGCVWRYCRFRSAQSRGRERARGYDVRVLWEGCHAA